MTAKVNLHIPSSRRTLRPEMYQQDWCVRVGLASAGSLANMLRGEGWSLSVPWGICALRDLKNCGRSWGSGWVPIVRRRDDLGVQILSDSSVAAINNLFVPRADADGTVECEANAPAVAFSIRGQHFNINPKDMIFKYSDGTCSSNCTH